MIFQKALEVKFIMNLSVSSFRTIKICILCLPKLQEISSEIVEILFAPKTIARQLTLAIALETGVVSTEYLIYIRFST